MASNRRIQAKSNIEDLISEKEITKIQKDINIEEKRISKKTQKKEELENILGYKIIKKIKVLLDDWYLDPIIGLIAPGVGDMITSALTFPYICFALFQVKSIPLTLAITLNILVDNLVGLIPCIGNIFDIFYRCNRKNYNLIVKFVEDDEETVKEVNKKAFISVILIAIVCVLIYYAIILLKYCINWFIGLF